LFEVEVTRKAMSCPAAAACWTAAVTSTSTVWPADTLPSDPAVVIAAGALFR
jgi:hypothetical protein